MVDLKSMSTEELHEITAAIESELSTRHDAMREKAKERFIKAYYELFAEYPETYLKVFCPGCMEYCYLDGDVTLTDDLFEIRYERDVELFLDKSYSEVEEK